VPKNIYKILS